MASLVLLASVLRQLAKSSVVVVAVESIVSKSSSCSNS